MIAMWGRPADATVMVEVQLEDMIRDAHGIVLARVTHTGVQMVMSEGSMDPHTVTTLEVDRWLKGEGEQTLQLRELGGEYADPEGGMAGMAVVGVPTYQPRDEVIVFLDFDPTDPHRYFRTLEMTQGKFNVVRGLPGVPARVQRDLSGVGFASWLDGQMSIDHGGIQAMLLSDFIDLVQDTQRFIDPNTGGVAP